MDNSLDMDMDGGLNRSLTNSQIYDGEFFEIVGSEGEILVVRCNICTPDGNDGQLLRTSVKSNGNILKHIKRRHSELLEKIKAAKSVKSRAPRNLKRGGQMMSMEDVKPFKKKMVQIKVKKQHEDELLDDGETQVYIANEDGDSMPANQDLYLIEPVDGITESDNDEYVEFEIEGGKCEDRGSGDISGGGGITNMDDMNDENSLLTAPEFEYVGHRSNKPAAKRLRESAVETPHEFTTYKRVSNGGASSSSSDRALIELQKKLMQAEYDHKKKLRDERHQLEIAEFEHTKKLRDEKHQLEIAILKADLTNKTLEHQKQMELLNEKLHG